MTSTVERQIESKKTHGLTSSTDRLARRASYLAPWIQGHDLPYKSFKFVRMHHTSYQIGKPDAVISCLCDHDLTVCLLTL